MRTATANNSMRNYFLNKYCDNFITSIESPVVSWAMCIAAHWTTTALASFLHMLCNKFYRQRWYLLTFKTSSNLWQTEFVVACVGSHYPFASTKSLVIYYSGSFTSALVIAEPRKIPIRRNCSHRGEGKRMRASTAPNGNKINAFHLVYFVVNVDFRCEERKVEIAQGDRRTLTNWFENWFLWK